MIDPGLVLRVTAILTRNDAVSVVAGLRIQLGYAVVTVLCLSEAMWHGSSIASAA